GGAQQRYGVRPDLTTLGKVVGGGMPVGAFGGRADVMERIAPNGPVYQAGTLSGNPVAMAAGIATLDLVAVRGFHDRIERTAMRLIDGLSAAASRHGVPVVTVQVGGMFGLFFTDQGEVTRYEQVMACDAKRF